MVTCNIATVCIAWYSFRKIFSKKISLVGTLIYVFQPYRLSCLYKRAAVGEYTAMIFYPLIFWGLYNIYSAEPAPKETKGIKRIIYNAKIILPAVLGYSGIVSSHVISLLLVGTVTIIFCIVMLKKTFRPSILIRLLAAVGMIILVNAWYLIPMADSMRSGISANSIASIRNFQKHGTYTFQLFDIFPNGDGQSLYAQDEINPPEFGEHDMSYSTGVGIISICIWIYYITANKTKKGKVRTIGNASCALCALCLYMTTIWFPWDFLTRVVPLAAKIFGNIQFPWRYLGLAGILSTINAMCLIETVNCSHEKTNNIGKIISASFISLTIISAMYFLHSYEITTKWNDYTSDVAVATTHLQGAEYLPDNTKIEIFNNPNPTPSTSVILSSFERKGDDIILTIEDTNGTDSYIDVPFLYYPGYVARYQTTGQMLDTVKAPDNRVRVIVPSGYNGTITVKYRERMLWRLGDIITAISALGIIVIIIKSQSIIKDKRIS